MKKILFFSFLFLFVFIVEVNASDVPFWKMNKYQIDNALSPILMENSSFEDRVCRIAEMRIGTPYKLGPLGEDDERGPVFTIDTTDCTVFVLTTLALANRCTYNNARYMMKYLNYYDPPLTPGNLVRYGNRIHFTYDRLHSCKYFSDITTSLLPKEDLEQVNVTLNRQSDGRELLPIKWSKSVSAYYIPMKYVDEKLLQSLHSNALGVGFVRKKNFKIGVVISHEGFILNKKYLVHADSVAQKVSKVDFVEYCQENSDYFDGVIISSFNF